MKKKSIALSILFLLYCFNCTHIPKTHGQTHQRSGIWDAAEKVWRGNYSLEDLDRWSKKLERAKSMNKWLGVSLCHNVIGVMHYYEGNLDRALGHINQSLHIDRENGFKKMIMRDLLWIGQIQKIKGLNEKALKSFEESMAIAEDTDSGGMVGRNLRFIGLILLGKGRYSDSMKHLERSLQMAEERQDDRLMMFCLNSIGLVYRNQGNFKKADDFITRSLKISQKLGSQRWMALNISVLGDICSQQRDYNCAVTQYEKSLTLHKALSDKKGLCITYNKIGKIFLQSNELETALHNFEKSHSIALDLGMRSFLAYTSANIGKIHGKMRQWNKALERTDEAIGILREVGTLDPLRDCYYMKGIFLEHTGNVTGAERNYKESIKILESLREDLTGGEEAMVVFVEKRGKVYKRLIRLFLQQGKIAEALEYLERSRLKKLRDQFDQLKPRLKSQEEKKAREKDFSLREEIQTLRDQLTDEKSQPESKQNKERIVTLERTLGTKRQTYIEYINDLREKFPELASILSIQPDILLDLQRLLPPHVAIVQYLIMEKQLYIFVVAKESLSYREVKIAKSDLIGKIDYLRSLIMNPQIPLSLGPLDIKSLRPINETSSGLFEMFIAPFCKASEDLYQLLIKPVEHDLSQFKILCIIPNGKLHLLPFKILGKKKNEREFEFMVETKSIFYLNSQSLLKFAQNRAKGIDKNDKLIAFSNPDDSLRYAEEEIELIKGIFSKSTAYHRKDATEDKLKKGLSGFDILHLSTHGKMAGKIKESYILLAPSIDGKEDGRLFLREIWGLQLTGYQLVTLSACETARGKDASGDIMVSLETAFLRAGTPTILASLWAVDDQATGILMKAFYNNLMVYGKAEALRKAQLCLLRNPKYVYPYYWAPFILVGDWR